MLNGPRVRYFFLRKKVQMAGDAVRSFDLQLKYQFFELNFLVRGHCPATGTFQVELKLLDEVFLMT